MNDTNKKIDALIRAERMKKIKIILALAGALILLIGFSYANKGGVLMI